MKFQVYLACVATAALLLPASLRAEGFGVAVIKPDGSKHEIEFSNLHRIDIASDAITVHHISGEKTAHPYSEVERIDVGVKTTGIEGIVADGSVAIWPTLVTDVITVSGASAGTKVTVYTTTGMAMTSAVVAESTLTLDLSNLASGTYIVAVGKQSVKVAKR